MKKILFSAVFMTAIVMGVNGAEYRHISPVTIKLIEFNMDEMRNASNDNLELYLTNLSSLQSEIERQDKTIAEAQKNLKSEKKLYDAQVSFLKGRQAMVKNEKKFYEGQLKDYDGQIKNIKKQYEMIQKMSDVSSVAMQEQLSMLKKQEQDCHDRKAQIAQLIKKVTDEDEKALDADYETLSQYLIEINDKTTRLDNLAVQSKSDLNVVKAQIKNIKDQAKAAAKK